MMYRISLGFVLACGLAALAPASAWADGAHVLYNFPNVNQGASPHAGLIRDATGNLYGTTFLGGGQPDGNGTVFELAADGTYTMLHAFKGGFYSDGDYPAGTLVRDSSGNLYGTTEAGGIDGGCTMNGCGTIFEVAPDGTETVLYIFQGTDDGAQPLAALLPDGSGGFYGTAFGAGANKDGAVFRFSSAGQESVVYTFAGGSDGAGPKSDLIADKSGNLYGTTSEGGGTGCGGFGCGTVFKIAPGGTESVMYAFTGGSDGGNPAAGVIRDRKGNLYGTTEFGGSSGGCGGGGCGTVFKIAKNGAFSALYTFTGGKDGGQPVASLISDGAGNLYGTALFWGADGYGAVFKLKPGGKEQVLHSFSGGADGADPWCSLLKVGTKLIGSTEGGGTYTDGVIFELKE